MKVKSESEVAQSFPTLSDPMDCSLPGSSIHGIFQARVLEWVAIVFSERTKPREYQIVRTPTKENYCMNPLIGGTSRSLVGWGLLAKGKG